MTNKTANKSDRKPPRHPYRLLALLIAFGLLFGSVAFKALGWAGAEELTRWGVVGIVVGVAASILRT